MLQNIRDNSNGVGSKIFIGLIVLVFALFGVDSLVGTLVNPNSVTSVNGVDIDELVLEEKTRQKTQEFTETLGEVFDFSMLDPELLREAALADLIQEELLFQAAEDSGMRISDKTLDLQIAQTTEFQVDGTFDLERAQILLQSVGYTPTTYRLSLARERVLNQLAIAYTASGFSTSFEIEQAAALTMQERSFRYLLIDVNNLMGGIDVSEAEIEAYYEENQSSFMQEEQVSLEYIVLDKFSLYDEVEVSEEQLRAQYALRMEEYESQIERRASHILLEAFTDDEYAAAQTLAEELKTRIDAGESFEDLAAEYSTDLGSAPDGGDVGYTTGDNFVEEFEEALKSLAVNEVSMPVKTDFGYHLIKLTEQSSTEVQSYEDLRAAMMRDLQEGEVNSLYLSRSEELNNLSFESLDLLDPAEILDLEIQTTELFGRSGGFGIASDASVISAAFARDVLEEGLNSELIAIDESTNVVIRLLEHTLPEIKSLDVVRGEIELALRMQGASEQAEETGATIINSVENGLNIDNLLTLQNINWVQADAIERSDTTLSPLLLSKVFAMGKTTSESNETIIKGFLLESGQYAVIELQDVVAGDINDLESAEEEGVTAFITQKSGADDFDGFLSGIESRATIK